MRTSLAAAVLLWSGSTLHRVAAQEDADVGFDLLFETAPEEFRERCVEATHAAGGALPAWVAGDFVIPSVGRFELGGRRFAGYGDAFGKLHKFSLGAGGQVCATYRMMMTGFLNESIKEGTIGPGLLFYETEPPRKCPVYNPVCNLMGANDNTFVNTIRHGGRLLSMTDSPHMLAIDPVTLDVVGQQPWDDDLARGMAYTGSAHPLRDPSTGQWLDFVGVSSLFSKEAHVRLFHMDDARPTTRAALADVTMGSPPYMHSFGVTARHVVLPRMPVEFEAGSLVDVALHQAPMSELFKDVNLTGPGPANAFWLVPLAGGPPAVRFLPADDRLYYTHVVNAYEEGAQVVIDVATSDRNAFAGDLTVATMKDKAKRDAGLAAPRFVVRRFLVPLEQGDGLVASRALSDTRASTDFPKVNPRVQGKKHCFFWAVTWFADHAAQASMALAKYDVCGAAAAAAAPGAPAARWARPHWYPSEPTVVPAPGAGAEDDGVLVFTALDGARGETHLMVLDARTMQPISEAGPFPRIGFTTHGAFYPKGAEAASATAEAPSSSSSSSSSSPASAGGRPAGQMYI